METRIILAYGFQTAADPMAHAVRPATIRLRTLGRIDLADAGRDLDELLGRPKEFALVVYLATAASGGGYVTRDALLALFWPGMDEQHARHALRQMLYALRQHLGSEVIRCRGTREVGLDPELLHCDAGELMAAAARGDPEGVHALYGGDFLVGFNPGDVSAELEQWIDQVRVRLRTRAIEAARSLARSAESDGRLADAIRYNRRAVEIDPLSEVDVHRLVRLLGRTESVALALEIYERYRLRLESDLDLRPGPEIQAEVEGLLTRQRRAGPITRGALRPSARVEPPAAATAPVPRPAGQGGGPAPMRRRALLVAVVVAVAAVSLMILDRSRAGGRAVPPTDGASLRIAIVPIPRPDDPFPEATRLAYASAWAVDETEGLDVVEPGVVQALVQRPGSSGPSALVRAARAELHADLVLTSQPAPGSRGVVLLEAWDSASGDRPLAQATLNLAGAGGDLRVGIRAVAALIRARVGRDIAAEPVALPSSPEALDALALGDGYLHRGEPQAAIRELRRAVAADSDFAIAWHRLSVAAGLAFDGALADSAAERAGREAAELPPRLGLLIEARRAYRKGDAEEAETALRALLAEDPDDFQAGYQLAEVLFHLNPVRGRPAAEALPWLRRPTVPGVARAEALYHLGQLCLLEGDTAAFRTAAVELLSLSPAAQRIPQVRVLMAHVAGDPIGWRRELGRLASAGQLTILSAVHNLAVYGRSPRAASAVARLLIDDARAPEERALGYRVLADLELARGRPTAAWRLLRVAEREHPEASLVHHAFMAALPTVPADPAMVRELRQRVAALRPDPDPDPWFFMAGSLYPELPAYLESLLALKQGRPDRAARLLRSLGDPGDSDSRARLFALLSRRYWLATGSPSGPEMAALAAVRITAEQAAISPLHSSPDLRYLLALHVEKGDHPRRALRLLRSIEENSIPDLALAGPARLAAARIHERLEETNQAARLYRAALELWADAEPAYQPLIERARDGLARVGG